MPVLAESAAAFLEVDIHLDLLDRPVNLLEEHIDVRASDGTLADSSQIAIRMGEIRRMLCASPAYLKSRGTPRSLDDLSRHDCISFVPLQSPTAWTFKKDQTDYVVPVRSRIVLNHLESTCEAARSGMGIATVFSYQVAELVKSGELALLLQDFEPPPIPVSLVYPPNRFMPVKLRAFLEFALARLKHALPICRNVPPRKARWGVYLDERVLTYGDTALMAACAAKTRNEAATG